MNVILAIPLGVRLVVLFLAGACMAGLVNRAVYGLAWNRLGVSPWSRRHPRDEHDSWLDRLPLFGWWRLRRKADQLGTRFWLRPLLVDALCGFFVAGLYWWEVVFGGLLPVAAWAAGMQPALAAMLHLQWLAHVLLVLLMLAASLIDLDEQTIPDEITVPGALLGMLLAAVLPAMLLPGQVGPGGHIIPVHVAFPENWPAELAPFPNGLSLAIALGCYLLWCVALLPRPWRTRHGLRRAVAILTARVRREPFSLVVLGLAVLGSCGIAAVWWWGGDHWIGLLTSLVGLAGGGLLIWLTRILGSWALQREAMGFGDVTLLAMIGAFLGWQAALLVFFLAPFAGLVVGVVQWAVHREHVLPYGPFLCLATLVVTLFWPALWARVDHLFAVPWLVPSVVGVCLVLMGVLLGLWQLIRGVLFGRS